MPADNKQGFRIDRSQPADDKDQIVVSKGQFYYWWKFPFTPKQIRIVKPPRSSLTQSAYFAQCWDFEDKIKLWTIEDGQSVIEEYSEEMQEFLEELDEKVNNMPESLQDSPTAELLRERMESVTGVVDALEALDAHFDNKPCGIDYDNDNEFEEAITDWEEELTSEVNNICFE